MPKGRLKNIYQDNRDLSFLQAKTRTKLNCKIYISRGGIRIEEMSRRGTAQN